MRDVQQENKQSMKLSLVERLPDTLKNNSVVLKIEKGQRLFRKGDRAECTYLIKQGRFQEISYPQIGKVAVLQTLTSGEVLGESSLHTKIYQSTVIARTEAKVIAYPNYILLETLKKSPLLVDSTIEILTQKINELQMRLEWRNISIAEYRVWEYLKYKLEKLSDDGDLAQTQTFTLDEPLQEIAAELGFVPGTLSRALAKLEAESRISRQKNRITVHDVA